MKKLLVLLCVINLILGTVGITVAAPIIYDELVDGDLMDHTATLSASDFFVFDIGINTYTGSMTWENTDFMSADWDIVPFTIPVGMYLSTVTYTAKQVDGTGIISRTGERLNVYDSSYGNRTIIEETSGVFPFTDLPLFESSLPLRAGNYSANWSYVSGSLPPQTYATWDYSLKFTVNPVPEPTTMLLLSSGLVGLAVIGRKRFKK